MISLVPLLENDTNINQKRSLQKPVVFYMKLVISMLHTVKQIANTLSWNLSTLNTHLHFLHFLAPASISCTDFMMNPSTSIVFKAWKSFTFTWIHINPQAPSWEPAICCCVVVAAAYTYRGGRPGPPKCGCKVLYFWKFTSFCSLKPLWSGMGEVVPAHTSLALHPPSPQTVHQLLRLAL